MSKTWTPTLVRGYRIASGLIRIAVTFLQLWWLVIPMACYFSPISPHFRWSYEYVPLGQARIFTSCRYLGARGFVSPVIDSNCPGITLIDRRNGQIVLTTQL